MISPNVRGISFGYMCELRRLKFRVHFAKPPHETEIENMSCVLTEIESGLSFPLRKIEEEYLVVLPPTRPNNLGSIVYARCESPDFLPPA